MTLDCPLGFGQYGEEGGRPMANDDMIKDQSSDRPLDEIDAQAAAHLLRWAVEGVPSAARHRRHARPGTFRRRVRHLRTAFAGDVRMSFIFFLAVVLAAGTGWLAAHIWHDQAQTNEIARIRANARADGANQVLRFMSRVQETPEANAELIKAVEVLYRALQNTNYDPDRIGQLQ